MELQNIILFVEDETNLLNSLSFILENEGYTILKSESGEEALEIVKNTVPQLVILDINLPGMNGFEVAEALKSDQRTQNVFIIMLSGRDLEDDIVHALESAADDYITKPVKPRMLIARINAAFRRLKSGGNVFPHMAKSNNITVDETSYEVKIKGKLLDLTRTEFAILNLLYKEQNKVFSREDIINILHGKDHFVTDRAIDFQIFGLRKKLGEYGKCVETVRGIGYKFKMGV